MLVLFFIAFSSIFVECNSLYIPVILPIGIGPVADEWSSKELDWFEEYVLEKSFFAMELSRLEGKSTVALLDPSQSDTVDNTDALKGVFPQR